jgi:hypothetical protein
MNKLGGHLMIPPFVSYVTITSYNYTMAECSPIFLLVKIALIVQFYIGNGGGPFCFLFQWHRPLVGKSPGWKPVPLGGKFLGGGS